MRGSTTPTHAVEHVDAPTSPSSTGEHVDAPTSHSSTAEHVDVPTDVRTAVRRVSRRGKAPPVDPFTGES